MMGLVETLLYTMKYLPYFGGKLFATVVEGDQSAGSVRFLLKQLHKTLNKIVEYVPPEPGRDGDGPWLVDCGNENEVRRLTVADCSLFGILQYARYMFGWGLTAGYPRLARFYDAFERRESAAVDTTHERMESVLSTVRLDASAN